MHHLRTALLALCAATLVLSCARQTSVDPAPTPPRRSSTSAPEGPVPGGLGTQGENPTGFGNFGSGEVTQATYLMPDLGHRANFVRAYRVPAPKQEDVETFESRVNNGKIFQVKAGDRFTITRKDTNVVNEQGVKSIFYRVEMTSGEHVGERGSIFADHMRKD